MDSAVAEARKSVELDPLGRQWPLRLARQLMLARRYTEAEAIYRRMIRDDPQEWPPYIGLSDLYRTMGRMRDAIAMWRAADEAAADSSRRGPASRGAERSGAARWFADRARNGSIRWSGEARGRGGLDRRHSPTPMPVRDTTRPCDGSTRCSSSGIQPSRPSPWIRNSTSCAAIRATRLGGEAALEPGRRSGEHSG